MSRSGNKNLENLCLTKQETCDTVETISRFLCTGEERGDTTAEHIGPCNKRCVGATYS